MNKPNKKWYKLDNAAKIFPPTTSKKDPKVFRIVCELFEDIDCEKLQLALNKTLEEFPLFKSSLKKGLFWYYLETSQVKPVVFKENKNICDEISNDLLFNVSYYKKRINLEVHHSLTDGTGTVLFIKSLVSNYLILKHNIKKKILIDNHSIYEKENDSYEKYFNKNDKNKSEKKIKAHNLKGTTYPENSLKIIEGIVSTNKIVDLSKQYNTTITIFLSSLLIKSILDTMSRREKRKPVVITIPVNLRKYFKSNTIRNFFNTFTVSYYSNEENDSLENIINNVSKQFKEKLTKENLSKQMASLIVLENIFLIRLVPVFLKDIVLKKFYEASRKEQTIALSNIGIIEMPEVLNKYINLFSIFASTDSTQLCMCSYLDKMTFSFSSHFINSEIQKNFFKYLREFDIEIIINDNLLEDSLYEEML